MPMHAFWDSTHSRAWEAQRMLFCCCLQHKRREEPGSDRRGGDGGAALGLGFGAPPILSSISDHQPKAQVTILCWLTVMPRLLHVSSVNSGEHKPSPKGFAFGVCVCVCFFCS